MEKVSFRIRVCLQAYRKSLEMHLALAAEGVFNRQGMTFSATSGKPCPFKLQCREFFGKL